MTDYDAIVIGSGAGGLTTAVALARAGQRVLVLEQHYLPGGWCHSFSLDGFQFSPGVHYIGGLGEGGQLRDVYEGLGVAEHMTFLELNPDGYDHVISAGEKFDIPKGRDNYQRRLSDRFPDQREAIGRWFDEVEAINDEIAESFRVRGVLDAIKLPGKKRHLLANWARSLNGLYDHAGVTDPMVRTIMGSIAGDHGVGPRRASAALHAAVVGHYLDGGWYPKGGAKAIPKAFLKTLRKHGGEIRVRAAVEQILVEGEGDKRRAVGVRLASGEEIRADVVVSNADPGVTFGKLVKGEHQSAKLRLNVRRLKYSTATFSLFLAVDMDLAAMGFDSGNYWYSKSPDLDAVYDQGRDGRALYGEIEGLFATITTLKDRTKRKDGLHTMEIFSFAPWQAVERWQASQLGDRPDAYESLKRTVIDRMLQATDRFIPGLSEHVVFQSLGTPLTNRDYVAATDGNIYGIEKTRTQLGPLSFGVTTEIGGLYLCGASTIAHGVAGATYSGIAAARKILGVRTREILDEQGQHLVTLPCDHPERWPALLDASATEPVPGEGAAARKSA
jgi:phytoene dehydrogenase-like protein